MPTSCHLLELCQELRDLIYEYALAETSVPAIEPTIPSQEATETTAQLKLVEDDFDAHGWQYHLPISPPQPTWWSLMKCNRQLRAEVTDLLARRNTSRASRNDPPASKADTKISLTLDYPLCTPTLTSLPTPPARIHTLTLNINLSNLYHPSTLPPSRALASSTWQILQCYRSFGPHLNRRTPLTQPLAISTLRVELQAPQPKDLVFAYGNPWMQMQSHYDALKCGLGVLAKEARAMGGGEVKGLEVIETRFATRRQMEWERAFDAEGIARFHGGDEMEGELTRAPGLEEVAV